MPPSVIWCWLLGHPAWKNLLSLSERLCFMRILSSLEWLQKWRIVKQKLRVAIALMLCLTCCHHLRDWSLIRPTSAIVIWPKLFFAAEKLFCVMGRHVWASSSCLFLCYCSPYVFILFMQLTRCLRVRGIGVVFRWQCLEHVSVMRQTPDPVLVHSWQHRWCRTLLVSTIRSDIYYAMLCIWLTYKVMLLVFWSTLQHLMQQTLMSPFFSC